MIKKLYNLYFVPFNQWGLYTLRCTNTTRDTDVDDGSLSKIGPYVPNIIMTHSVTMRRKILRTSPLGPLSLSENDLNIRVRTFRSREVVPLSIFLSIGTSRRLSRGGGAGGVRETDSEVNSLLVTYVYSFDGLQSLSCGVLLIFLVIVPECPDSIEDKDRRPHLLE